MKRLMAMAVCAAALSATPVLAEDLPAGGLTGAEVVSWLQKAGYKAEPHFDADRHYVATSADGYNFDVQLYDCKDTGRCASMRFQVGVDLKDGLTLEKANEWNFSKRYGQMSLDDEKDPWVGWDVNLSPGGTWEALNDDFASWLGVLDNLNDFLH